MKKIYIAGAITPYDTDPPVSGYWGNIRRGIRMGIELMFAGFTPYNLFLDFFYYPLLRNGENLTENMLKKVDFPWLESCDAVLVLSKYRKSEGTKAEITRAKEIGIPVFYSLDDLMDYDSEKEE